MRFFRTLLLFVAAGGCAYWAWYQNAFTRDTLEEIFDSGEFLTLESRYSAEQIMTREAARLLTHNGQTFLRPTLRYYPYLLMEVKYSSGRETEEGVLLWGLNDGEMVIDTGSWEISHGFEDCLKAHADRNDYKIINALSLHGGALDRDALLRELRVEGTTLETWMDQTREKQLVVQSSSDYRLHFESPRLAQTPQTIVRQRLVTRPYKHAQRMAKKYSRSQIERNAKAAFGEDFAIKGFREIFLPVYTLEVKNADGSVATTYWNALNGEQLSTLNYR